jgi:hypothetical protein
MTDALVDAGLWIPGPTGWQFHDWVQYQDSKQEVEAKRQKWANDKRRQRAYRTTVSVQESTAMSTVDSPMDSTQESVESPGTGTGIGTGSTELFFKNKEENRFAEFYEAYPRKMKRGDAEKAWKQMIRAGFPAQVIIDGAFRFAADPNLPVDRSFIPYPASWLRARSWEDEPLPARRGTTTGSARSDETKELFRKAAERDAARSRLEITG